MYGGVADSSCARATLDGGALEEEALAALTVALLDADAEEDAAGFDA